MKGLKFRSLSELNVIDSRIIRYYYQYTEDRLGVCVLVAHGLVHVVPDVRWCGPSWTTWTFYMERYCGFLKNGLRSKVHPWANLNNRVLNYAYLEQLGVRYDLEDELKVFGQRSSGLSGSEKTYPHCKFLDCRLDFSSYNPRPADRPPSSLPQILHSRRRPAASSCRLLCVCPRQTHEHNSSASPRCHGELG